MISSGSIIFSKSVKFNFNTLTCNINLLLLRNYNRELKPGILLLLAGIKIKLQKDT